MFDRQRRGAFRRRWVTHRPWCEALEGRQLLATLQPISNVTVPERLGIQVPLQGGTAAQTFTVASNNPNVQASVARGSFLTINVSHASSGATDPAFNGALTFQLFEDLTPTTAARIESLVTSGFYTSPTNNNTFPSKNFHRIAANFPGPTDFIVQGGSATGTGTGSVNQPGFPFSDEFNQQLVFTGTGQLAMANAGDDTNDSQFFITTGGPRFLDQNHTIFGQLVEGQEILAQMTQVARDSGDVPVSPILITGTTLSPTSPDGVIHINATGAAAGQTATITVTATEPSDNNSTTTQTFQVNVGQNSQNERAFLGPVSNQVVGVNQTSRFSLTAVNPEPSDTLSYTVRGGIANDPANPGQRIFTPIDPTQATASVDSQGNVTVIPNTLFTGTLNLVVGVRDQVNRAGGTDANAVANFDTQAITLTVTNNTRPTAQAINAQTPQNVATNIQLAGDTGDPSSSQTLTFALDSQPARGTISGFNTATGALVYTPSPNFVGTDTFTYHVRDVGEPTPNLDSLTATVTITVTPGTPINIRPTALPGSVSVIANTPVPVQLTGNSNNAESGQGLTFAIATQPTNGTVTDLNPQTGSFTYTPRANFVGTDTLTFNVTDTGAPTPNLTSDNATVTFTVTGAVATGAVRQIGRVLVVTPLPRPRRDRGTNVITVSQVNNQAVVTVNGAIDTTRPNISDLDRIVVFGAKASDRISVSPDLTLPATLDGGHGGRNVLVGGGGPTREHGWFGRNRLTGGPQFDNLIGRQGRVRFVRSAGNDLLFLGDTKVRPERDHEKNIVPPTGQFYRFAGNRVVPVSRPFAGARRRQRPGSDS